ncbi:MAG TPA: hypothetical protein VFX54_05295 [Candidatus Binatia bacterium]|nr:hypothetical protein [Candidatus Binatia bacterium]
MPEWLVQVDPATALLTIWSSRYRRKFRKHDPNSKSMGEGHGLFQALLVAVWVTDDQISVKQARIRACTQQVFYGALKLGRIHFAAGLFLPGKRTAFET